MPQAATNGIEWLHSAFVFIRCTLGCIVYCINSSYSKYSLLKKASETSIILYNDVSSFRRKRLVFSDNNFQDYEFTRLNTHVKKEMSEELTIILSNNYYWNQLLDSNFGYIFTTDCTDYTDFSSQEATMAGCRTIRMAGAAEAQKSV